ncbi:RNase adapter RapZ [Seleniivibrio woodruffii]|uniref:RNase adapter RapZ n=1 Tax=Seleniivibrio woodruffii TaxID=1078050 RepID=UPI00240A7CC0|nr:RNase adapter RapZ [Seleniivibrio woodruffii]
MEGDKSLVVLTGLSGGGKSVAAATLEDLGFYTIDNLPLRLLDKFVELMLVYENELNKVALVIDSRSKDIAAAVEKIKILQEKYAAKVVYLHAADDVLIRRFKETRRKHPMGDNLTDAIHSEREKLCPIRDYADLVIDTSTLNVHELKRRVEDFFSVEMQSGLIITVQSFGFKYGLPQDSDLVFDVRFLKNPYFVEELREKTGLEQAVSDYVFSDHATKQFLFKLKGLLGFLIPHYIREGKKFLTVSIGCTGGRHRSVAISEFIAKYLENKAKIKVNIRHRDVNR